MTTEPNEGDLHTEALIAFHDALTSVEDVAKSETADTGKYTYSYASLSAILEEVKRACEMHGLALTQTPTMTEGMLAVYTKLIHKNGGEVNFDPIMLRLPAEAQPFGSALTYLRRYSLMTIFAISTEDDDGKAATQAARAPEEYGGYRSGAEQKVREMLSELDPEKGAETKEEFRKAFGCGLSELPVNRHGDALTWLTRRMTDPPELASGTP